MSLNVSGGWSEKDDYKSHQQLMKIMTVEATGDSEIPWGELWYGSKRGLKIEFQGTQKFDGWGRGNTEAKGTEYRKPEKLVPWMSR